MDGNLYGGKTDSDVRHRFEKFPLAEKVLGGVNDNQKVIFKRQPILHFIRDNSLNSNLSGKKWEKASLEFSLCQLISYP